VSLQSQNLSTVNVPVRCNFVAAIGTRFKVHWFCKQHIPGHDLYVTLKFHNESPAEAGLFKWPDYSTTQEMDGGFEFDRTETTGAL
jgi:hypothetical protein